MVRDLRACVAALVAAVSVGCGGGTPAAPAAKPAAAPAEKKAAPAEPAASAEPPSAAEHGGVPKDPNERPETPHGGSMVVVGDKAAHLEVVFDPSSGRFAIYSYGPDGHTPLKLKVAALEAMVTPDGAAAPVAATLGAVTDAASGDRPGDSAHFETTAASLKGVAKFNAVVRGLPEGAQVSFAFPM